VAGYWGRSEACSPTT